MRLNIVLYLVLVSGKSVRCGVAALCETADMPTMRWMVWTLVWTLTHASQHTHRYWDLYGEGRNKVGHKTFPITRDQNMKSPHVIKNILMLPSPDSPAKECAEKITFPLS